MGALDRRAAAGDRPDPGAAPLVHRRAAPRGHHHARRLHRRPPPPPGGAAAPSTTASRPASPGSTATASRSSPRPCRPSPGTSAASSTTTCSSTRSTPPPSPVDGRPALPRRLALEARRNHQGRRSPSSWSWSRPTPRTCTSSTPRHRRRGPQVGEGDIDWPVLAEQLDRLAPASGSSRRSGRATRTMARASGSPSTGWRSGSERVTPRPPPPCGSCRGRGRPAWPARAGRRRGRRAGAPAGRLAPPGAARRPAAGARRPRSVSAPVGRGTASASRSPRCGTPSARCARPSPHSHLSWANVVTAVATVGPPTALVTTEHGIAIDDLVYHGTRVARPAQGAGPHRPAASRRRRHRGGRRHRQLRARQVAPVPLDARPRHPERRRPAGPTARSAPPACTCLDRPARPREAGRPPAALFALLRADIPGAARARRYRPRGGRAARPRRRPRTRLVDELRRPRRPGSGARATPTSWCSCRSGRTAPTRCSTPSCTGSAPSRRRSAATRRSSRPALVAHDDHAAVARLVAPSRGWTPTRGRRSRPAGRTAPQCAPRSPWSTATSGRAMTSVVLAANNGEVGGGEVMLLSTGRLCATWGWRWRSWPRAAGGTRRRRGGRLRGPAPRGRPSALHRRAAGVARGRRRLLWCHGLVPAFATAGRPPHRAPAPAARPASTGRLPRGSPGGRPSPWSPRMDGRRVPGAGCCRTGPPTSVSRRRPAARPRRMGFLGRHSVDKGLVVLAPGSPGGPHRPGRCHLLLAGEDGSPRRRRLGGAPVVESWSRSRGSSSGRGGSPARPSSRRRRLVVPQWSGVVGAVVAEAMSARTPSSSRDAGALAEVARPAHPWVARPCGHAVALAVDAWADAVSWRAAARSRAAECSQAAPHARSRGSTSHPPPACPAVRWPPDLGRTRVPVARMCRHSET